MRIKKGYRDFEKYMLARKREKKRYYAKTAIYGRVPWTEEADQLVLVHSMSDSELSSVVKHSVKAIQTRRRRLKLESKEDKALTTVLGICYTLAGEHILQERKKVDVDDAAVFGEENLKRAKQVIVDEGISERKADVVLQGTCYILLGGKLLGILKD